MHTNEHGHAHTHTHARRPPHVNVNDNYIIWIMNIYMCCLKLRTIASAIGSMVPACTTVVRICYVR